MNRRLLLAASLLGVMAFGACTNAVDGNPLVPPGFDGGLPFDGAFPTFDAAGRDAAPGPRPDASADAAPPIDSTVPVDGAAPDATDSALPDAADAHVADANVPDTSVADTYAPDTTVADANLPDTNLPDTNAPDARDGNAPDAFDANGPDVFDGGDNCVVNVWGDHYETTDGTIVYGSGVPTVIVDNATGFALTGITSVAQQRFSACGLRSDQTVWCWPLSTSFANDNGGLGNGVLGGTLPPVGHATQVVTNAADAGAPKHLGQVMSLSVTNTFYETTTCAIRADKTVWCWGSSDSNGGGPSGLYWGTTGSLNSVPYAFPLANGPAGDGGVVPIMAADQVTIGDRHACYLLAGAVYCWGMNVAGNLGVGDTTYRTYPVAVSASTGLPSNVTAIASGYDFTCALTGGGQVWCWGTVGASQTGNPYAGHQVCNSNYCQWLPTPVQESLPDGGLGPDSGINPSPLTGATSLLSSYQSSCVINASNDLLCWGAYNGGVSAWPAATPYTPSFGTAPYTNIAKVTTVGGDINTGLIYLTKGAIYVKNRQQVGPICP